MTGKILAPHIWRPIKELVFCPMHGSLSVREMAERYLPPPAHCVMDIFFLQQNWFWIAKLRLFEAREVCHETDGINHFADAMLRQVFGPSDCLKKNLMRCGVEAAIGRIEE